MFSNVRRVRTTVMTVKTREVYQMQRPAVAKVYWCVSGSGSGLLQTEILISWRKLSRSLRDFAAYVNCPDSSHSLAFPLWIIFRSVRDSPNPAAQTASVRTGSFPSFYGGAVLILLSAQSVWGWKGVSRVSCP